MKIENESLDQLLIVCDALDSLLRAGEEQEKKKEVSKGRGLDLPCSPSIFLEFLDSSISLDDASGHQTSDRLTSVVQEHLQCLLTTDGLILDV